MEYKLTNEQDNILDYVQKEEGMLLVPAGAGCVDKDTEFLTTKGWKFISDYKKEDKVAQWSKDGSIEFVKPLRFIQRKTDILNHVKSNTVDMVISDDHRTPYLDSSKSIKVKQFKNIKHKAKLCIPRTYTSLVSFNKVSIEEESLRVLVMQSADGSIVKNSKQFKISLNFKKQAKIERAIYLLENADISYKKYNMKDGYIRIVYCPNAAISFKGLSSLWGCSEDQLRIVGDEAVFWDSHIYSRKNVTTYQFTGNKEDCDLIQHAWHLTTGNYVTIVKDKRQYKNTPIYRVLSSNRKVSDLTFKSNRNRKLSTITDYKTLDGYEYCFTTPSTFWLARRNGKVFPTGNCGKTYIAIKLVQKLNPKKGLYTAFNKAIVQESEEKFRNFNMECKTFHALAYRYCKPSKSPEELSYECIKEDLEYSEKADLIEGINLFFVSDSVDMYEYFTSYFEDNDYLSGLAVSYVDKMIKKEIPCTFNFMLKNLHLMLDQGLKCEYDIVILDEINDTTAVALEIFKLIQSKIKIGLGESNQAIYHFLNLKDGFKELKNVKRFPLTNSFRCSKPIASKIQNFMRTHVNHEFTFTGTENPVKNGNTLYVTLTNSSIILIIKQFLSLNKSFTLLRKVQDIFAYPLAIMSASSGKKVYQHKYKFLEKEYLKYKKTDWQKKSFYSYLVKTVGDQETESAVNLIMSLKSSNTNLFDLYKKAKEITPDPKYTIATVFTSKGLEYETVYVNKDLNIRIQSIIDNGGIETEEDLVAFRCYYVACSRAGLNLYDADHLKV